MDPIHISGLRKTYDGTVALDGVDLTIEPATLHCLVGPNGSGKSTLLRVLLGLTEADAGEIRTPDARFGCGFQQPRLFPTLTVAENLDVFGSLAGGVDPAWRETVVESLRLETVLDRPARDLSGGFAKKLDLALALLAEPEFLLLDEPLSELDDVSKAHLHTVLTEYRDAGNAVVVATHNLADFRETFDRLTILHEGSVLLDEYRADVALDDTESYDEFYVDLVLEHERRETGVGELSPE
jgi:ABC-2 type transport system ATP-binding protein